MRERVRRDKNETGAALVTVILISVLLLTASIAMLTAVGANSRNSTDVLSETKAYYAAESGIQATVNVLRNKIEPDGTIVNYSEATNDPDLSTWLPYNYPTSGTPTRAVIGQAAGSYTPSSGVAYSIAVVDPDNSANSSTFTSVGGIAPEPAVSPNPTPTPGSWVASRIFRNATDGANNYTTLSFVPAASTTVNHPDIGPFPEIGRFRVECTGNCGPIPVDTRFRVDFTLTYPRAGVAAMIGTIYLDAGVPKIKYDTYGYTLLGGPITLCKIPSCAAAGNPTLVMPAAGGVHETVAGYANADPILPYRLKITSTGYGPNGAVKKLEAIIQKNLVNNQTNVAATTMLGGQCVPSGSGPTAVHCFEPGTSAQVAYSGGNCAIGCVPSFGFNNPSNYQVAMGSPLLTANPPRMTPPPAMLSSEIPQWQRSPADMDVFIDALRREAQRGAVAGGRYLNPGPNNVVNPGDYATGKGVTFCEGSCNVSGAGGGTLVVTGKLTNLGGFDFKGMIIVIGEEGWERTGGGGGSIIGNVVIAPYNLKVSPPNVRPYVPQSPIPANFYPPRYWINGGGASDIIYQDVSATFDSISAISDLIVGVAEK